MVASNPMTGTAVKAEYFLENKRLDTKERERKKERKKKLGWLELRFDDITD